VDYGTEINVRPGEACYLAREFFSLPAQAIECSLACLSPSGEEWSFESGEILSQACGSLVLWAEVQKFVNDIPHVFLIKTVGERGDVCLNDILLDANLAIFTEPTQGDAGSDLAAAAGGTSDDVEDENSSVHSFRTAVDDESNLADGSTPFTTPSQMDPEIALLVDLAFEQDVISQLKSGELDDMTDLEVVTMAKTVLCRKRVALTKKLGICNNDINDIIVDKLAWLEQQIDWLTKRIEFMMQTR